MEALGYTAGRNLRTAAYDWRKWGDSCYSKSLLKAIQALIEDTYHNGQPRGGNSTSGMRRVRLICHSMGCSVIHAFLDSAVNAAWKDKYISGLIAMGPSWAGAASTPESWVAGPIYSYVPIQLSNLALTASATWPAMLALFPYELSFQDESVRVWPANQTILASATREDKCAVTR